MPFINGKYEIGITVKGDEYERVIRYFLTQSRVHPDGPVTYWKKFQYNKKQYIVTFQYNIYRVSGREFKRWSDFRWAEEQCGMSKD